ncbi:kinase-like protein [Lindgomyces ingoldianus]|uniref:Kinase-like protein n=1 Tax=Lindgomyces ingoldianus TaxID=673940 RepID=A0ACB6RDR6_9PLEO|nr:kinase-like protein [Lindgomyces ingoldianus]KAF2477180.1 kinase-like protein [Lindgomyces ingoldianus]
MLRKDAATHCITANRPSRIRNLPRTDRICIRNDSYIKGGVGRVGQRSCQRTRSGPAAPTQYSYYNGTLGPMNPYTTRASFEWQETLGQGTYGQVSKVRETSTGTFYAQKIIRVTDPRSKARVEKEVLNGVSIMQKLRHHHIASVQFHVFELDTYSIIMLPVAECDLRRYPRRCIDAQFPRTDLTHLTSWFGCLVGALAFAHSKHIKREDIKPGNILIKDHQPYLAGFGCAKDFSGLDSSTSLDTLTFGTPVYWAPEGQPRGRSTDVFSLGCVFSESSQSDTNEVWKNTKPFDMFNIAIMLMLSGRTWIRLSIG